MVLQEHFDVVKCLVSIWFIIATWFLLFSSFLLPFLRMMLGPINFFSILSNIIMCVLVLCFWICMANIAIVEKYIVCHDFGTVLKREEEKNETKTI